MRRPRARGLRPPPPPIPEGFMYHPWSSGNHLVPIAAMEPALRVDMVQYDGLGSANRKALQSYLDPHYSPIGPWSPAHE